jgi:hypothetical protein
MDIVDSENIKLNGAALAPRVIADALEQKRRFYGSDEKGASGGSVATDAVMK